MDKIERNVINIDYPCIQDIVIRKEETDVSFTVIEGQNERKLFLKKGEDVMLTVNYGDVSKIRFGGTDNWGKDRLPLYIAFEENSANYDSIYVDTIEIQELAGNGNWCKCELVNDNKNVKYTALQTNPYNAPRTAYFWHKTEDNTVKSGFNVGRPVSKEWCVTVIQEANPNGQSEELPSITFDDIINEMNPILIDNGFQQVSYSSTPKVYNYLNGMYNAALAEWNNKDSKLFSKETYPEIYDYRGNNVKYNNEARSAMLSWIIAMCLTELAPNSGKLTNAQTQYFLSAYNLGGGRRIPLFDNYDIHSDVMIARFAAGVVYSLERGKYTFDNINAIRKEIGGEIINAFNWEGLGYYSPDNKSIGNIGYVVNSDAILPSGAGPYSDDSDQSRQKPFEEGQPIDQFYMDNYDDDWYLYNYKIDVEIDKYLTSNYNMGSYTYNQGKGTGEWETYDKDKKLILLHASVMPFATDHYFFGSRRVKFAGVDYNPKYDFWQYNFNLTNEEVTDENNVFDVSGPFAEFENKLFYGEYGITPTMEFIQNVMKMADNSRFPTYHTEYGRRRPLGGITPGTARAGEVNGHPLNGILNGSIGRFFADTEADYDKYSDSDDFPHDGPRTYPSGHSAMTWTVAMLFTQMFVNKDRAIEFMKAAYKIGVGRTVGRFHWTSDTLYGRLFATFILPLVNAMNGSDFQRQYESAKSVLVNSQYSGDWNVNLIIKNNTGKDIQSTGEIRLYTNNHIGMDAYLPGASVTAGALYTWKTGESLYKTNIVVHGDDVPPVNYIGDVINEVRFYDYRHYHNRDVGFSATLDTDDLRCDNIIKEGGATYVIKIENL